MKNLFKRNTKITDEEQCDCIHTEVVETDSDEDGAPIEEDYGKADKELTKRSVVAILLIIVAITLFVFACIFTFAPDVIFGDNKGQIVASAEEYSEAMACADTEETTYLNFTDRFFTVPGVVSHYVFMKTDVDPYIPTDFSLYTISSLGDFYYLPVFNVITSNKLMSTDNWYVGFEIDGENIYTDDPDTVYFVSRFDGNVNVIYSLSCNIDVNSNTISFDYDTLKFNNLGTANSYLAVNYYMNRVFFYLNNDYWEDLQYDDEVCWSNYLALSDVDNINTYRYGSYQKYDTTDYVTQVENENTSLKNENSTLTEQNSTLQSQVDSLTEENATLTEQNSTLQLQVDSLTSENATLKDENETLVAEKELLQEQFDEYKSDMAQFQEDYDNVVSERDYYKNANTELRQENSNLQTRLDKAESAYEEVCKIRDNYQSQNETLTAENNALQADKTNLQAQVEALTTEKEDYQYKYLKKCDDYDALKQKNNEYQLAIAIATDEINRLEEENTNLHTEVDNISEQKEAYEVNYYSMVSQYNQLKYESDNKIAQLNQTIMTQYTERYDEGYSDGYNTCLNDGNIVTDGIISIVDSPFAIIREIFNFEIFGINVSGLIFFVLSLLIVGFVLKKFI